MRRRVFLGLAAAAVAGPALAQPGVRVRRVGVLGSFPPSGHTAKAYDAFVDVLKERGWTEPQNLLVDRRYSQGRVERFIELAEELVRAGSDVIVAPSTQAALSARKVTTTVPIVTVLAGDPVGSGLAASLAHPGGNVTGMSSQAPDFTAKTLEILLSIVNVTRVAVSWNPTQPAHVASAKAIESIAPQLKLQLLWVEIRQAEDLEPAFAAIGRGRVGALQVLDDVVASTHRQRIVDFATASRLPAIYLWRYYLEAGGLMSYGPGLVDLFRKAASYVDRILRGARAADLPMEQPTRFELVVNVKAARAIGLAIPPMVLARADEVLE